MTSPPERRASRYAASPTRGVESSEFKLAVIPLIVGLLAAILTWVDKLPTWAQSPAVLVTAIACATVILAAYIVSRGLAKHQVTELHPPQLPVPTRTRNS